MQPILPALLDQPLHDVARIRAIETRALASTPPQALMQRAGAALARLTLAVAPHARRVWIAVGPGNNGGDGLEAAIELARAGRRVEVALHAGAVTPDDAAVALQRARAAGVSIVPDAVAPEKADAWHRDDAAIDALFGLGSRRAPTGAIAHAIRRLNALPGTIVAADLPSGLHPDTGTLLGDEAVIATHTLTFLALKPGLFTAQGRDHAGRVWLDGLGVDPDGPPSAWLRGAPAHRAACVRRHGQHKGSFGDLVVIGGASGMTGAALLAARSAHAAGAGRVFVELLAADDSTPGVDIGRPELMFRSRFSADPAALARATVVCGCGGGDLVRGVLPRVLGRAPRLVIDADALNAIAADSALATQLSARRAGSTVLTPHPLEAARLLGATTAEVQRDRLGAARSLCDRFNSVVVLKGSGSIVAAPGLAPGINASGNASLATAGTGDVLAGWIGGSWAASAAQRSENTPAATLALATRAVAEHGAAAEPAGAGPLRANDLVERLYRGLR